LDPGSRKKWLEEAYRQVATFNQVVAHVGRRHSVPFTGGWVSWMRGSVTVFDDEIQLAQPADRAAVATCVRLAYSRYVARLGRKPAPMTADYASMIERRAVYLVRDPTTRSVRAVLVMMPGEDWMFIENVAVDPRHQGQGIGSRLLAFAEHQAADAGLREMRLYTNELMTENIAYYQRRGYEEVDRRMDHGFRRVFMRKLLQKAGDD
jgi:ribosomal protein S18 acetylase RimI-like enzyme